MIVGNKQKVSNFEILGQMKAAPQRIIFDIEMTSEQHSGAMLLLDTIRKYCQEWDGITGIRCNERKEI